ncbi:MAG TPA: DUF5681 domain-containing protein [Rhizomicrobium sp.]|jgi:hypothetical protein|nr:DUF5681 domain-containing protein [Rhizomicrobium sp.]
MSSSDSNYKVGPGKPPLHTRFRKGQSGNPSGKPGPAKLTRQRFDRALCAMLDSEMAAVKDARPHGVLDSMVRRLALDALGGRMTAIQLILRQLDKEVARGDDSEAENVEAKVDATKADEEEEESDEQGAAAAPLEDYALWVKTHGK